MKIISLVIFLLIVPMIAVVLENNRRKKDEAERIERLMRKLRDGDNYYE